ncbi:membrane protein [Klebsiella pneumoniae]|nr:membrane protein [Klebsiella pneumoniae]
MVLTKCFFRRENLMASLLFCIVSYGLLSTWLWMFATSLDDAPQLLEKFSQLRDIGKRVSTDDETSLSGKPC